MLVHSKTEIRLDTRRQNHVSNEINWEGVRAGDLIQSSDLRRGYDGAQHRPTDPSRKYNCHGLTFASRRTFIWQSAEIRKILEDDGYEKIPIEQVMTGDVALYYSDGDAEHSGIVVAMGDLKVPLILSKWGVCHEVVHRVWECPYDASQVEYYRMKS